MIEKIRDRLPRRDTALRVGTSIAALGLFGLEKISSNRPLPDSGLSPGEISAPYEGDKSIYKYEGVDESVVKILTEAGILWSYREAEGGLYDVKILSGEDRRQMIESSTGLNLAPNRIDIESTLNRRSFWNSVSNGDPEAAFASYDGIRQELSNWEENYPDLVELRAMDLRSGMNREAPYAVLSNSGFDVREPGKVSVILFAGQHGMAESGTIDIALRIGENLLSRFENGDPQAGLFLNIAELVIAPSVNPDGLERGREEGTEWRKTGVPDYGCAALGHKGAAGFSDGDDTNRGFGGQSDTNYCSMIHSGGPFTIPETKNVRSLLEETSGRGPVVIDLHSFVYERNQIEVRGPDLQNEYTDRMERAVNVFSSIIGGTVKEGFSIDSSGMLIVYAHGQSGEAAFLLEALSRSHDAEEAANASNRILEGIIVAGSARYSGDLYNNLGLPRARLGRVDIVPDGYSVTAYFDSGADGFAASFDSNIGGESEMNLGSVPIEGGIANIHVPGNFVAGEKSIVSVQACERISDICGAPVGLDFIAEDALPIEETPTATIQPTVTPQPAGISSARLPLVLR